MVAVVVVSAFGLCDAVDQFVSALSAAGQSVLDEAARAGDVREPLVELEDEWMAAVAAERGSRTAGKQVWWALDDDDIDPLRDSFEPILASHSKCDPTQGSMPIDRVAWSIHYHRYSSEH